LEAQIQATLKRLGLPLGLLKGLSGIQSRRFWDVGVQPSDAATMAAEKAIQAAGIDRSRIGMLVNTSVCRDYVEPSTACIVHGNLQLAPECLNFDIANACLGFLTGMEVVGNMIERGQIEYGIVVDGESSRFVVEKTLERLCGPEADADTFRQNFATLTLGSGAAAMVMGRDELVGSGHRFTGSVSRSATQYNQLCRGQRDHMKTDTQQLLHAGVQLAMKTWQLAREELDWRTVGPDELILHQVSKVHTETLARTLGLEMDRIMAIYPEYGNVGPASIPIALSKAIDQGRIKKGSRVALMGIGSGLNCAMAEVVW
jgi:3-oxoacyl-[acyl-carrier-protein] synthase-3